MNLEHVRSFALVAETGGFRLAAERSGMSQSTLSSHIAALEAQLGVQLIFRTTRRLRVTPIGERFLARARRAIEEIDHAAQTAVDELSALNGRVVIACTPTLAAHVIPHAIKAFNLRFPFVRIEVLDDGSDAVERLVVSGGADLGVGSPPARSDSLTYTPVSRERFCVLVNSASPLFGAASLTIRDLAAQPIITMLPQTSLRSTLEKAFRLRGETPFQPAYSVRHHSTAVGLVEAGCGVCVLPESILSNLSSPHLRAVPLRPDLIRELGVFQRRGEGLGATAIAMMNEIRRSLQRSAPGKIGFGQKAKPSTRLPSKTHGR